VSGPVPYYRPPATTESGHHGIDVVASVPELGRCRLVPSRRRWVLRPGPAGRRDSWGQGACLEGRLLKDEHRRVFPVCGLLL